MKRRNRLTTWQRWWWFTLLISLLLAVGLLSGSTIGAANPSTQSVFWTHQAYAHQGPFEYVSPRPSAELVSAYTTIAVRQGDSIDETSLHDELFTVEGSESGLHPGSVFLADDELTTIFKPDAPFTPSETVTVTVASGIRTEAGEALEGLTYTFTVSSKPLDTVAQYSQVDEPNVEYALADEGTEALEISQAEHSYGQEAFTVPDTFPPITITVPANNTGDGYLFLSNLTRRTPHPYLLIMDDNGEPVFYKKLVEGLRYADFKKQPNGLLTYYDRPADVFRAMDSSYRFVDTYQAGNGYQINSHGFQLREDGHILLQIYDRQPLDMSQIVAGGVPTATVVGAVVQELDPSRNVIFEWRSWDHFDITDASDDIDLTAEVVDVTHINSVEWDHDGNILISNRHLDEITKLDRRTADVIWRMGGKRNEFTFINEDRPFSHQHDARRLPNGNITLYDNGNTNDPQYSRAVEYQLDEAASLTAANKTATKVWEYRNQPDDFYGGARGNAQRLPNGNTVINWGRAQSGSTLPVVTEVQPDGTKAFEMYFINNESSYRAFRYTWEGRPFEPPTLVVSATEPETNLHYSWNGATHVASYRIYGGATTAPSELVDTQVKTSFETSSVLSDGVQNPVLPTIRRANGVTEGCYFYRVMPIDIEGHETKYSNLVFTGDASCELVATLTPAAPTTKTFTSTQPEPPFITTVQVPSGAVSDTVVLIYTDGGDLIQPPPEAWHATEMVFTLNAHQDGNPQMDFSFTIPITIQLQYTDQATVGLDESVLELRRWDRQEQTWTSEGLSVVERDTAHNRLTFTTTYLGEFAVFGQYPRIELVRDGGFEQGADNSEWEQGSTNLPNLICDGQCSYDGIPQSHSGDYWVWFGGWFSQREEAYIRQAFAVPSGTVMTATLTFWFRIAESSYTGEDTFAVSIDDTTLLTIPDSDVAAYQHYTPISLDVSLYISGSHVLRFDALIEAEHQTSFYLDDVSLVVQGDFPSPKSIFLPLVHSSTPTGVTRTEELVGIASIRRLSAVLSLSKGRPSGRIETQDARGPTDNPLGLDTSLRSYSTGAGFVLPRLLEKIPRPHRLTDYVTAPDDLPSVTISVNLPEASDGYIFMAPYERRIGGTPYSPYLIIVDGTGELVYYKKQPAAAEDFKKQVGEVLSYSVGGSSRHDIMDSSYNVVDSITAANGYHSDFHDFQILPNGHVLLLIYEERQMDMSQIVPGGYPDATVVGCRVQELDEARDVVFEWTSFDHIPITDTTVSLLDQRIDYVHCNAIELDTDGHLLLSCRDTDEVIKIDSDTGDILWRLGGKGNQFEFVNAIGAQDVVFIKQHDVRRVANGNPSVVSEAASGLRITLFDNRMGAANYSRAVEYQLDEANRIATLVWEYRNTPDIHGHILGNAQRLPNGNTLIGWGSGHPAVAEVKRDGTKVFELLLPLEMQSYRAFRFPWVGRPDTEPTLVVETENQTVTTLSYSWNGATDVAAYRVYGDPSDFPTTLLKVEPKTGFETTTVFTSLADSGYNFRVVPLNEAGEPMIPDPATPTPTSTPTATPTTTYQAYLPLLWKRR